jgi:hypothetical protein
MSDIPRGGNLSDFIPTAKQKIKQAQGETRRFPVENPNQASANRGREYGEYFAADQRKQIANPFPDSAGRSNIGDRKK